MIWRGGVPALDDADLDAEFLRRSSGEDDCDRDGQTDDGGQKSDVVKKSCKAWAQWFMNTVRNSALCGGGTMCYIR